MAEQESVPGFDGWDAQFEFAGGMGGDRLISCCRGSVFEVAEVDEGGLQVAEVPVPRCGGELDELLEVAGRDEVKEVPVEVAAVLGCLLGKVGEAEVVCKAAAQRIERRSFWS